LKTHEKVLKDLIVEHSTSLASTPSVSKYLSQLTFFATLIIRLIQKIVQVQFILFNICFNVVCILSLTYVYLFAIIFNKTNDKVARKSQQQQVI
jgi:hypothetical protein